MVWRPPSEKRFNDEWVTIEVAPWLAPDKLDEFQRRRWLMARLKSGQVVAVARTGQPTADQDELSPFVPVPANRWRQWDDDGNDDFWDSGDATFHVPGPAGYGINHIYRYFEIRFDPNSFEGKIPKTRPPDDPPSEPAVEAEPIRTKHIGTGEMAKFAKLYLEIWGEAAKEIPAWRAMKACYPDGIIGRDPFLKEFRELRGAGKRGNPAIREQ
jgi:hypothetical protein